MNSVLILDDRSDRLRHLENGLRGYQSQFKILTASTIQRSIQVMAASKISILICDTSLGMALLPLLVEILFRQPPIPCILLGDKEMELSPEPDSANGLVVFLCKPVQNVILGEWIYRWLDHLDEGWRGSGVSGKNFISLAEVLDASCQAEIQSAESERGYLRFNRGNLVEATCGDQSDRAAVEAIAPWENVNIILREDAGKGAAEDVGQDVDPEKQTRETECMSDRSGEMNPEILSQVNNLFQEFREINGYKAVGLFSSQAQLLSGNNTGAFHPAGMKILIGEMPISVQTTMHTVGFDGWDLIHLESAACHIVIKPWFTTSGAGDVVGSSMPFFIVLLLERDGNLGSGKMMLERFSTQPV